MVRQRHSHARLMGCLKRGQFQFVLGNDAGLIPSLINYVQSLVASIGLCDEADVIRVCIALEEALRNAMFHGNLELTSEQREGDPAEYQRLIDERNAREPYRRPQADVTVEVTPTSGRFVVRDQGPGFDPREAARSDRPGKSGKGQRPRPAADADLHGRGDVQRDRQPGDHDQALPGAACEPVGGSLR